MAESYLQLLEDRAINDALHQQPPIGLKTHKRYVDDSHSRFQELVDATRFMTELNKQDERVQYTMEVEAEDKSLAFLNVKMKNTKQGRDQVPEPLTVGKLMTVFLNGQQSPHWWGYC